QPTPEVRPLDRGRVLRDVSTLLLLREPFDSEDGAVQTVKHQRVARVGGWMRAAEGSNARGHRQLSAYLPIHTTLPSPLGQAVSGAARRLEAPAPSPSARPAAGRGREKHMVCQCVHCSRSYV